MSESSNNQLELIAVSSGDCPDCKHSTPASCKSPGYLDMPHKEKVQFWRDNNPPCSLFEPEI